MRKIQVFHFTFIVLENVADMGFFFLHTNTLNSVDQSTDLVDETIATGTSETSRIVGAVGIGAAVVCSIRTLVNVFAGISVTNFWFVSCKLYENLY